MTRSIASSRRVASTVSRIARIGLRRSMPTLLASGSHQAPSPRITRPGASSSSVEKVAASSPTLRVQIGITPDATLIRLVTDA